MDVSSWHFMAFFKFGHISSHHKKLDAGKIFGHFAAFQVSMLFQVSGPTRHWWPIHFHPGRTTNMHSKAWELWVKSMAWNSWDSRFLGSFQTCHQLILSISEVDMPAYSLLGLKLYQGVNERLNTTRFPFAQFRTCFILDVLNVLDLLEGSFMLLGTCQVHEYDPEIMLSTLRMHQTIWWWWWWWWCWCSK